MSAHLRLIQSNSQPAPHRRHDGPALHQLADRLTEQVQAGNPELAHVVAALENLNPFGVAVVATWMARAGVSEEQILDVVT